jgi:CheY-like chemotaxis protein
LPIPQILNVPFVNADADLSILVVDDDVDGADGVASLIRVALGCHVSVAYNGQDALSYVDITRPDAVVSDLQMPGVDGLSLAGRIRQRYVEDPPLLIALTGRADALRDLPFVYGSFDRVLAKPVDTDHLISAIRARRLGSATVRARQYRDFDFGELFTDIARQLLPASQAKTLTCSFDYRGPRVIVHDDPVEVQSGLHRLLQGLIDMVSAGFVIFTAEATLDEQGRCSIGIDAAASGKLASRKLIDAVIERLMLSETRPRHGRTDVRYASGTCPNTGAPVGLLCDEREGVRIQTLLTYERAAECADFSTNGVSGAIAWHIDEHSVSTACGERRLQRLGWVVQRFTSCEDAIAYARTHGEAHARSLPALLIVAEGQVNTVECFDALQKHLPPQTQRAFVVTAGSPALSTAAEAQEYDVWTSPISPRDIAGFCEHAEPGANFRNPDTESAPLGLDDRPLVLLVDDNDVNRVVGRAMVEALGYEVQTAHDGLDAIDKCRRTAPKIVLMDLDMPVLRGIDATLRLRELQRRGEVPPFPVIAATADSSPEAYRACIEAGMNAFLVKPLDLHVLRAHLRRFSTTSPRRS